MNLPFLVRTCKSVYVLICNTTFLNGVQKACVRGI